MGILDGKVVIVTGSARGMGAAEALDAAENGAEVVVTDILDERGNETAVEIGATYRSLDVTSKENWNDVVSSVLDEHGRIDGLVNNAGITRDNLMMRMKDEEWADVIGTNLNPLFTVSKACLRGMTKARWGRIINISSVVGQMGNAGQANYAASKAGAEGMSRAMAKELGSRAVTVNCVAPGFIDTDMTKVLTDDQKSMMRGQIPLGRLGEPEEIAKVVAFLASDAGAYITGETIHVNGGMYM